MILTKIHRLLHLLSFTTPLYFYPEAKNTMYWYERSLEYEQVNLNNSQLILSQGKSMIDVLESALRVIKYQESIN
ncbi:MAG: hypothetical protein IPG90_14925 [Bacteroidetes bacterium]|nr:hypothetical protein [Bacteroidota bacterium]